MVDVAPAALVRKDKHFKELGLDAGNYTTPEAVAKLLVEHPAADAAPDRGARWAGGGGGVRRRMWRRCCRGNRNRVDPGTGDPRQRTEAKWRSRAALLSNV